MYSQMDYNALVNTLEHSVQVNGLPLPPPPPSPGLSKVKQHTQTSSIIYLRSLRGTTEGISNQHVETIHEWWRSSLSILSMQSIKCIWRHFCDLIFNSHWRNIRFNWFSQFRLPYALSEEDKHYCDIFKQHTWMHQKYKSVIIRSRPHDCLNVRLLHNCTNVYIIVPMST